MDIKEQVEHLFAPKGVGEEKLALHEPLTEEAKRFALLVCDVLKPEHAISFVSTIKHLVNGMHANLQTWGANVEWETLVEVAKAENKKATPRSLSEVAESPDEEITPPEVIPGDGIEDVIPPVEEEVPPVVEPVVEPVIPPPDIPPSN